MLTVEGGKAEKDDRENLYQGISRRAFRRQFNLADYVEVTVAGANFENGLLQIDLVRELPEAMKPRRIEVKSGLDDARQQIEHKQAASAVRRHWPPHVSATATLLTVVSITSPWDDMA